LSPKRLVEQLTAKGIAAIAWPSVDGCRQYVYRTEEIAFAILK